MRTGSFEAIASVAAAPVLTFSSGLDEDALLMPAILFDGEGDRNHERRQGVVIGENNQ